VATWNDVSGTGNNASDLTINPANGAAYIWDERNHGVVARLFVFL